MTPEGRVKKMVRNLLDPYVERGLLHYDMPVQGGYGPAMLDFHGCHMGRYFAIETKAPGKKPTGRQITTMERITRTGGKAFVVSREEDLTPIKEWFGV